MSLSPDTFNRTEKLFVDRDGITPEEAARKLTGFRITLACGPEIMDSPTLQAAVLTAANLGNRVFRGAITMSLPQGLADAPLRVPWPARTFMEAAKQSSPEIQIDGCQNLRGATLVFGTRRDCTEGLQVTFDRWCAGVTPTAQGLRLGERDGCALAGVAAASLALSELFMAVADVAVEASHREIGLSLWRPDVSWREASACGPVVEFLPAEIWSLGLGHLGQAFLWCLGILPYPKPEATNIMLQDFDRVVPANVGTCALVEQADIGALKTRVACRWLEARGFKPRLLERRFDEHTRRTHGEPALALCGFDGAGPRHLLDDAGFSRVIECGLGGRSDNFDSLLMHALPRASAPAGKFWHPLATNDAHAETLARENTTYSDFKKRFGCGEIELAGRSVAVPFVGGVSASLVMAEALRMLHGGECFEAVDLRLASPRALNVQRSAHNYSECPPGLLFQPSLSQGRVPTNRTGALRPVRP